MGGADAGHEPVLARLGAFFTETIWTARRAELGRGRPALYRAARVVTSSVQGFFAHRLTVRAAALTYYSVLSLVPFLAFAFAVLKGFGAYQNFIQGTARPYLQDTFGGNPALLGSIERILQFVDRTDVSTLGAVGLLVLLYTCVSLLSSVEDSLNEIWGATTKRSFLRQVTDYVTLLVTAPLLVVAAGAVVTAAQSSRVVLFLTEHLGLGPVIDFLLHFASLAVVGMAFFAIYVILPNVRTRPLSAALGALVAAVLWQGALVLYVRFQMGVSSYNALYSVLSAIPIFLVWTYVSWVVVLVGAQVGASHQDERQAHQRFRARHADQSLRETLAVVLAAHVAREFVAGVPPLGAEALAARAHAPQLMVEETLEALARAGLLARAAASGTARYLPARDLDAIRVSDLLSALRREAQARALREEVERHAGAALAGLLAAAEDEARASPLNVTLRELAARAWPDEAPAKAPPAEQPSATARRPVLDAK